jgi:hypothetical protein
MQSKKRALRAATHGPAWNLNVLSMQIVPRTHDFDAREFDKCAVLLPTLEERS